MELRFYKVFGEINIEQLFEKIVKIIFGRFVKEVIGSALYNPEFELNSTNVCSLLPYLINVIFFTSLALPSDVDT